MSSIEQTVKRLSQEYFNDVMLSVKQIYVDMELLQDFKLGALLSTVTTKEEIEYIKSQLLEYNIRFDLETANHFPVLKKTDSELLDIINSNNKAIAMISPWTRIYDNFNAALKMIYTSTKNLQEGTQTINITVNCSDIQYPKDLFQYWVDGLCQIHPNVKVNLTTYHRYKAPLDFYNSFDMFFLYDHATFFNTPDLAKCIAQNAKRDFKIVYSPPFIDSKLKLDPSEYARALESTKAFLNLIVDFYYMPNGVDFNG